MTREGALLVMIAVAVVLLALGAIAWRRRQLDQGVQNFLHAEVVDRRAKKHRSDISL